MVLSFDRVSKTYEKSGQRIAALDNVSFTLNPGEFIAICGPSGCGKSTLLLTAGGLLKPDSGVVTLAGEPLYGISAEARARFRGQQVGFVFQQFHLIPYLSVFDNVRSAYLGHSNGNMDVGARARDLIERFGLSDRASHLPSELSVGERQRTALARALFNQPTLLLADEPTGNLDPENAARVLDYLAEFAAQGGAVLLVTHETHAAARATRRLTMAAGRIAEVGVEAAVADTRHPS